MGGGMPKKQKHEFAIYVDQLSYLVSSIAPGDVLTLEGENLYQRMVQVLRMRANDACLLFDRSIHVRFVLQEPKEKTRVSGVVHTKQPNTVLHPKITFLLPLLKRDDCDAAVYSLAEMGVNDIRMILTQKVQRSWGGEREFARLQRVMIAAAEQSKNFAFPTLYPPISLQESLKTNDATRIYFDPAGQPLFETMQLLHRDRPEQLVLMVGPEGDLDNAEKEALKKAKFIFCALTPTILRAAQAAAICDGIVRSVLTSL